ncbi:hypothetical protein ACEWY4_016754 [Coilia grayii]|uniref:PAS domain-containing protein n=1 Tax=Coilia grayii TaxID=363190 RepID=A0ABD1JLA3_9TELE
MVVTAEGYVFYSSPTIQDYLGFHQSDVVHQSVFELIHTDDRAMFRRQLHFALKPAQTEGGEASDAMQSSSEITSNLINYNPLHIPPENSSFLERSFCCRFRCLLDNSSGFLALNFQGRLKYLHGQNKMAEDGTMAHPQLALFLIATPLQPPSILEIRSKTLIFQTKHKLDFTPTGVDTRGKVALGYTEIELCSRGSGYQFIHAADMMYCADNHVRMMKTRESGFTVFRLLTKGGSWLWVQANARLVYKNGRPDFIVARQRALSNEEGEEHLRQRKNRLPFNFASGEAVLYETAPSLDMASIPSQGKDPPKLPKMAEQIAVDPNSMLGSMLKQDQMLYGQGGPEPGPGPGPGPRPGSAPFPPTPTMEVPLEVPLEVPMEKAFLDSHALLNVPGDTWQLPSTSPSGTAVKPEASMKDMVETLQQIISDASLCQDLRDVMDVGQLELKEWENTLLRINLTSSENSVELNDILTEDIFSYVEGLFKENGLQIPSSQGGFGELPDCLPELELPGAISMGEGQGFNCQVPLPNGPQSQGGLVGMGYQDGTGMGGSAVAPQGTMKLTHMDPEIPLAQTVPTANMLNQALPQTNGQRNLCNGASLQGFNPAALPGQYSQAQAQAQAQRHLSNGPQQNGRTTVPQRRILTRQQDMLGQVHPSVTNMPRHPMPAAPLPSQPVAFQGQNRPLNQPNGQNGPWVASLPGSAVVPDGVLGTCGQGMANHADMALNPSAAACLQGHFSLHTQPSQSQALHSWHAQQQLPQQQLAQQQLPQQPLPQQQMLQKQQQQQQLPNHMSNSHQHLSNCYSQTTDFQRDPMSQQLSQNTQGFGPQNPTTATTGVYHAPQPGLVGAPHLSKNSCMFNNSPPAPATTPSSVVNGMGLNHLQSDGLLVHQKMKALLNHHSPPQQTSCLYQRSTTNPLATQDALNPLTCQLTTGLPTDDLLAHRQFLNCSDQTQITHPLINDSDRFQFPNLAKETTYFAKNSQANSCDY